MSEFVMEADFPRTAAAGDRAGAGVPGFVVWGFPLLVGGALLAVAEGSLCPALLALLLLMLGAAITRSLGSRFEVRAFLLSYSGCVLVAGLSACYALAMFGEIMTTIDAWKFLGLLSEKPPYLSWHELVEMTDAPLAIVVWQQFCALVTGLGMPFGPYIPILFNAWLVALAGAMTISIGKHLFGDDALRLRRLGLLYAGCGLFWLFGAVLLRGSFVLFLNTLFLWSQVRLLTQRNAASILLAVVVTVIVYFGILYTRPKAVVTIPALWLCCVACWYLARIRWVHIILATSIPLALVIARPYIRDYVDTVAQYVSQKNESFTASTADASRADSLGIELVHNQRLPLRIVLGCGRMLVFPIPLWAYFEREAMEYHLIKGWQGLYMVAIVPLVVLAGLQAAKEFAQGGRDHAVVVYSCLFALLGLLGVVVTSLETRHHGPYIPAMLLLAASVDTEDPATRRHLKILTMIWLAVVLGVHALWLLLRFQ